MCPAELHAQQSFPYLEGTTTLSIVFLQEQKIKSNTSEGMYRCGSFVVIISTFICMKYENCYLNVIQWMSAVFLEFTRYDENIPVIF